MQSSTSLLSTRPDVEGALRNVGRPSPAPTGAAARDWQGEDKLFSHGEPLHFGVAMSQGVDPAGAGEPTEKGLYLPALGIPSPRPVVWAADDHEVAHPYTRFGRSGPEPGVPS